MSDHFVQTCFAFNATPAEAVKILQAQELADELSASAERAASGAFWDRLPESFRAHFPPTGALP